MAHINIKKIFIISSEGAEPLTQQRAMGLVHAAAPPQSAHYHLSQLAPPSQLREGAEGWGRDRRPQRPPLLLNGCEEVSDDDDDEEDSMTVLFESMMADLDTLNTAAAEEPAETVPLYLRSSYFKIF
jgi:hypothetical protein